MSAIISECGKYRYRLERDTQDLFYPNTGSIVNFIMLNPSTADATKDDPTIRRCRRFGMDWGFSRLVVTNLFAFRATKPVELRFAEDPVGPENDAHIMDVAAAASMIIYAWGKEGGFMGRADRVRQMLAGLPGAPPAQCLRISKEGQPWHPLYISADTRPIPFEGS